MNIKQGFGTILLCALCGLALGFLIGRFLLGAPIPPPVKETVQVTVPPVTITKGADFSRFQIGADGKQHPFVFVGTNRSHPVVKIMEAGFLQACKDFNLACKLYGVEGNDIPGSVTMGEQAVSDNVSGILNTVYDKAQWAPALAGIKAGIPTVNGHFPMKPTDLPGLNAWSAPDNVGYAVEAAKLMASVTSCKGPVAVTESGPSDAESAVGKAFTDTLKATCPGIVVLDPQMEGTDLPKAIAIVSAIISANPNITGAFSTTGGGIQAWANAAKDKGLAPGEIKIIGMDYSTQNLDFVKGGDAVALVAQPLYAEMYHGVVLLLEIRMGITVPFENTLPAPLVTAKDVEPYYAINKLAAEVQLP